MEKTPWGTPRAGGPGPSWGCLQTGAPHPGAGAYPGSHASSWGRCRGPWVMAEVGGPGERGRGRGRCSPWWLRTVRQPMQQFWRLAKARRPPTLPVSTVLQRVWSPPACEGRWWARCPPPTPTPVPPPAPRPYAAARPRLGPRPGWARRCAAEAWRAAAPGSTACRWASCAPARRGGPVGRAAGVVSHRGPGRDEGLRSLPGRGAGAVVNSGQPG